MGYSGNPTLPFGLSGISLNGEIPARFANLTQLRALVLSDCQITGQIPSWLMKMTHLQRIELSQNELQRIEISQNELQLPLPASISQLIQLKE